MKNFMKIDNLTPPTPKQGKGERMKELKFDDEICKCGHSKAYHQPHQIDKHGGKCEKCKCELYTWAKFVKYTDID